MANQRIAVVVGVDDSGVDTTLRYAVKDAHAVRDILCDPDIGTFDPGDVKLFAGPQADAAAIKAELRRIVDGSDKSDVLLVYFAGPTLTPAWSYDTDLYLATPGVSDNPDAGLRMAYLKRDVLEVFAGTALLILDCCRAGGLHATPELGVDMISVGGRDDSRYSALMTCARDAAAREEPVHGHGILTHHLLRALRGQATDRRGLVTFQAMTDHVLAQGLEPRPAIVTEARGATSVLTRPGPEVAGADRQPEAPQPEAVPLESPLDRHTAAITHLIDRVSRQAREPWPAVSPPPTEGAGMRAARVQYVKAATRAESVALLEYTANGFKQIDTTARFDLEEVRHLLHAPADASFPLDPVWFGHLVRDGGRTLLCLPVQRNAEKVLLLAVVNPPAELVALGQPLAKILETIWRTDFTAAPAEAEIQVLTALRETFGRLPTALYERCFQLYREVLESFSMVFQPIITIGPVPAQVGVHSYEALARRSPDDQRAPITMLQVAHAWGDRFVVERDKAILRKALATYARAHAEGPWDVPKPLSVNVSVRSLLSDSYIETVHAAITAAHLDPSAVTLEISEQDPIEPRPGEQWLDEPHAYFHKRLAAIARDVGVAFAVDDFGSGYASLSRMAELPLTQIKVDRAVLHHPQALQELALVVAIARDAIERGETHAPRVVIVEGVDDESPLSLRQIFERRIKHVQGYITREPAAPRLRRLRPEARKDIAARVRGDEPRPTALSRSESVGEAIPLRRGA